MTVRQLAMIGPFVFSVLTTPCLAGPCAKDIERIQVLIDQKLNATAAAGPMANQSVGAQMHRQPTPGSIAAAESKLGELSPKMIEAVKDAMTRARNADIAGDSEGCARALSEVQREITP